MTHLLLSLSLLTLLTGCALDPICPCETNKPNPCREEDDDLFPTQLLMRSYEGSALGQLIPLKIRLTPARTLYALLENGNQAAASTWAVGDDKEYSGSFEVFSSTQKGILVCRKFIQEMTIKTKDYGDLSFKGQGESCKRPPNTWRIVQEVQP